MKKDTIQEIVEDLFPKTNLTEHTFVKRAYEDKREQLRTALTSLKQQWLQEEIERLEGERVSKHDDLIDRPEENETWEHDDSRWEMVDISASVAEAYNQALNDIITHYKHQLKDNPHRN